MKLVCEMDATAGRGIAMRRGLGRVRHLQTQFLWIQHVFANGLAECKKIPRDINDADMGTKHPDVSSMKKFMEQLGLSFREGASKHALKAAI